MPSRRDLDPPIRTLHVAHRPPSSWHEHAENVHARDTTTTDGTVGRSLETDTVFGGAGDDIVSGGGGNDTLTSGVGLDVVLGGPGGDTIDTIDGDADLLSGNAGPDVCFFDEGIDTVFDCETSNPPPVKLPAIGDIGLCGGQQADVAASIVAGPGLLFAALGDISQQNGMPESYTDWHDPWSAQPLERTRPIPGNHDCGVPVAAAYLDYFGAVAGSPTEGWYAYDIGMGGSTRSTANAGMSVAVAPPTCSTSGHRQTWPRTRVNASPCTGADRSSPPWWRPTTWCTAPGLTSSSTATATSISAGPASASTANPYPTSSATSPSAPAAPP